MKPIKRGAACVPSIFRAAAAARSCSFRPAGAWIAFTVSLFLHGQGLGGPLFCTMFVPCLFRVFAPVLPHICLVFVSCICRMFFACFSHFLCCICAIFVLTFHPLPAWPLSSCRGSKDMQGWPGDPRATSVHGFSCRPVQLLPVPVRRTQPRPNQS